MCMDVTLIYTADCNGLRRPVPFFANIVGSFRLSTASFVTHNDIMRLDTGRLYQHKLCLDLEFVAATGRSSQLEENSILPRAMAVEKRSAGTSTKQVSYFDVDVGIC